MQTAGLQGTVMLVGDSMSRFAFDELVAWLRREGKPLRCVDADGPVWRPAGGTNKPLPAEAAAVLELASADRYERRPADCTRRSLRLLSRRLNLPPLATAPGAETFYDELFAPAGRGGVVVLHMGLWVGALARHEAFASHGSRHARYAAAVGAFHASIRAFFELACRKPDWPRLVLQQHLPQHFATATGEFGRSTTRPGCRALGKGAARDVWGRMVAPVLDAAAAAARSRGGRCARRVQMLRGFWPLVERSDEHPGRLAARGRGGGNGSRADCTHWLPCSSAMNLQLRLLLDAVAAPATVE